MSRGGGKMRELFCRSGSADRREACGGPLWASIVWPVFANVCTQERLLRFPLGFKGRLFADRVSLS